MAQNQDTDRCTTSDWNGIQLLSLRDHEVNVRQQARMAIFQSKQHRSRLFQLIEVLNITLATVRSVLCLRSIKFSLMNSRLRLAFHLRMTNFCMTR